MLNFFPTPYPDEIFYSVLCRYHLRSVNNSSKQSNLDLWNRVPGKGLLFPEGITHLTEKIPSQANLSAEQFIRENTIFPLLKPFISKNRGETVLNMMKNGTSGRSISAAAGFMGNRFTIPKYLRCCEQCVHDDTSIYGEAYWHRLHQLPGVYVCPKHGTQIIETNISISTLKQKYYPTIPVLMQESKIFSADITAKLAWFSADAEWILNHGEKLGCYEETCRIYDDILKTKGFRHLTGRNRYDRLSSAIVEFYSKEFLNLFSAYNSGTCQWCGWLLRETDKAFNLVYHLLLIRFLAGSAENFFAAEHEKPLEPLSFGEPPYPCRNLLCEYHLQDVIEKIEITRGLKEYRADFVCPYCGMIYKRITSIAKEKQYTGQVNVIDYGWKWKEKVKELFVANNTPYAISKLLHCGHSTAVKFGAEYGFLRLEDFKKRKSNSINGKRKKMSAKTQKKYYRQQWLNLISANPSAKRSELYLKANNCYCWLTQNDKEWYEQNAPKSRKGSGMVDWEERDYEYINLLKIAVEKIRAEEIKPKLITIPSVARKAGIGKYLSKDMALGRLPKTQAFLNENLDSREQWHKRKILWAVKVLREQGRLKLKWLRVMVSIPPKEFDPLRGFVYEAMHSLDDN